MHYLETYNASEGFFAVQTDPLRHMMSMLLDIGVFFEFIPLDQTGEKFPDAATAWTVRGGKDICARNHIVQRTVAIRHRRYSANRGAAIRSTSP